MVQPEQPRQNDFFDPIEMADAGLDANLKADRIEWMRRTGLLDYDQHPELFNKEEMNLFALTLERAEDLEEWLHTTPPRGTEAITSDYSQDIFEFGGLPKPDGRFR